MVTKGPLVASGMAAVAIWRFAVVGILFGLAMVASAEVEVAPRIERLDAAACGEIVSADAAVETLAEGFKFTEGPVWVREGGGYLVFSDIPSDELKKWTRSGGVETFRKPSRHTNGNTLDREGRLVSCEHGARRVSLTEKDGGVRALATSHGGKRFNSPNDAAVKSDGSIWFTDPPYGLKQSGGEKEMDGHFVFRLDPGTGETRIVAKDFDMPNGICFSPDEARLYVADSGKPKHVRVFRVGAGGALEGGEVFAEIDVGGPDGIRCDDGGRLWSSSGDGVQVFLPDGRRIARIVLPKGAANLCFGGAEGRTLFMTARDRLYAVETKVCGASVAR